MALVVSGITVINMLSRPERWDLFQQGRKEWEAAFGVSPERCPAVVGIDLPNFGQPPWFTGRLSERRKLSWGGKAGCILSHRKAIATAMERKWDNVLILEDDAYLTADSARAWQDGLSRLLDAVSEDWVGIYLCTTTLFPPNRVVARQGDIRLVETTGALGTVAYLLNGRVFRPLLAELPMESGIWPWVARHKTIDRWLSQNLFRFGRVYALAPSLAGHHTVGSSDISMTPGDDHLLDFSLSDIPVCPDGPVFEFRRRLRLMTTGLSRRFTLFRQGIKRLHGL